MTARDRVLKEWEKVVIAALTWGLTPGEVLEMIRQAGHGKEGMIGRDRSYELGSLTPPDCY